MPEGEEIDAVDEHDSVVGSTTVGEALKRGQLHRAVAVVVLRSNGKILLQQRSKRDHWHPGLWTLSSTGHVRKGESYGAAAARELKEELGIESRPRPLGKYLLPPMRSGALVEREWVAMFEARTDLPCVVDPEEVEGVKEVEALRTMKTVDGEPLTPDAVLLLTEYLNLVKRDQD